MREKTKAAKPGGSEELAALYAAQLDTSWRLALLATGRADLAEDVVQEAFMSVLRRGEGLAPGGEARSYFARAVINAARDQARSEARRRRREASAAASPREPAPADEIERRETAAAVAVALAALDADERAAVALRYREGFGLREIGETLGVPTSSADVLVRRGTDNLRKRLVAAGFGAVALEAALAAWGPAHAPAALAGKLAALARGQRTAPRGGAASKGGLAMKIALGVAAAGLVAGAALWAANGKSEESAKPPEPAKPKFDKPVWDPSAEWERAGFYASSGASGDMDGPRMDFMGRRSPGVSAVGGIKFEGNEKTCQAYDLKLDRVHVAAGSATGYLDGPFSRARFVGGHYSARGKSATSLDGRYVYETEPQLKHCMRRIDYAQQEVKTLTPDVKGGFAGLVAGKKHALYALTGGNEILFMDADAKVEGKVTAQLPEKQGIGGWGCTLALDEEKERLYASRQFVSNIEWYIWYWDLKDGSFHGVLQQMKRGEKGHLTGPLEGTALYPELWVRFGPDDPPKNNIWFGCTDMGNVWRLDQEAKEIWALSAAQGGGKNTARVNWVGKGGAPKGWTAHGGFGWVPDGSGDFYIPHDGGGPTILFKRVK